MKTPVFLWSVLAATTSLMAAPDSADRAALNEPVAAAEAPVASHVKAAKPVLEKGMAAETIVRLIGKPQEVAPLSPAESKAEKWTYRRRVSERTTQEAATTHTIPAYLGFTSGGPSIGTTEILDFRLKHTTTSQVTSLLLIDGKLVLAKQWQEQSQSYDN